MGPGQIAVTVDAAKGAADRAMRRFTGLLRAGVDPKAKVSDEWTVRDVAAHIAGFMPIYVDMARGRPSPIPTLDGLGRFNQRLLAVDEHNVYVFADTIDRGMADLLDAVGECDGDVTIGWHGRLQLPLSTMLGLVAGEGYVHGYDVARRTRSPWVIPPEDAVTMFRAALPLFPSILDRDHARDLLGTVEVRLRATEDGRWKFRFDAGDLTIERADGARADWTMSAAPAAYLLAAYGRLSPAKATLTGQIIGWGRRPSLGLRFGKAFRTF